MQMKIISWNVNGLRSNIVDSNTAKYKFPRTIETDSALNKIITVYNPDIICFQETRLGPDLYHLFESSNIKSHFPHQYWSSSQGEKGRSGNRYSGTSIWSKHKADKVTYDFVELGDKEGRFIQISFPNLILITTYTPNTGSNWDYRLKHWEPKIRAYLKKMKDTHDKPIVYCGDYNIAQKKDIWFGDLLERRHQLEQDVVTKKILMKKIKSHAPYHDGKKMLCGYSVEERDAFKKLLEENNFVDCFRLLNPSVVDQFTWYNIRIKNSFNYNIGWLIDRFIVQDEHKHRIKDCKILKEIGIRNEQNTFISDHLPIFLHLELPSLPLPNPLDQ